MPRAAFCRDVALGFGLAMAACLGTAPVLAQDRASVSASAPVRQAVTVYRDPARAPGDAMDRDWPGGFAMISETRRVTLPPGRSTVRFAGVAEGMVAVSAMVTGLPGGTIEKNRNADLLSPAALVDGTLGNRVRVRRTDPATGVAQSESAIIRTRADGGIVLQTGAGFEAVRCSGLPESLVFDRLPEGLSAEPVFSIDTVDPVGGSYTITLSYLAWGFDWEANYVATLHEGRPAEDARFDLVSWLTLLNDNGQSFEAAEVMAVAGTLSVESDYANLADAPEARPLRLACYPIGSTAAGSALPAPPVPPPPMMAQRMNRMPVAEMADAASPIVVTGSRKVMATEEDLADLKLYRVPERMTVAAKGVKQVAFLERESVQGRLFYQVDCAAWSWAMPEALPADIVLATVNDAKHGLGVALPAGRVAVFERAAAGEFYVAEESLRDYAAGQDVELPMGASTAVFARCRTIDRPARDREWARMGVTLSNATAAPVTVRLALGSPLAWQVRGLDTRLQDGRSVAEIVVAANATRDLEWQVRAIDAR